MDYPGIFLTSAGGLGLFIYGMHVMASGLQKAAGSRMKRLLEALTKNKLLGILVGAGVTAIIQSSSATTVMVVGFVNAGLMNLTQSVGVIMGANVGTTITAWIVSSVEWSTLLKPSTIAPLLSVCGAFMVLLPKKDSIRHTGEIIVGLGILFMGMTMMSDGLKPLADSEAFRNAFVTLGANPALGILAGMGVTAIIQSSSASVGILQSLAFSGLIPWNTAIYIILGQNIGTCITALISSIGASRNARSAAYIHLLFNVIGSLLFGCVAFAYLTFINKTIGVSIITGTEIGIVHTVFNIANTIALFPFSGIIINIAKKMAFSSKSEPDESETVHLDDRVLTTPSFAIQNSLKEITRLANLSLDNLIAATESLFDKDSDKIEKIHKREANIDFLCHSITQYLVKICKGPLTEQENRTLTALFHTLNDVERIGDHSENIAELTEYAIQENVEFSDVAANDLHEIINATVSCFKHSVSAFTNDNPEAIEIVFKEEELIDSLEKRLRAGHIKRLANGECVTSSGVVFLDTLTNLERVSDHARNIAEMVFNERNDKKHLSPSPKH